mgnify:CR=1 FL=1
MIEEKVDGRGAALTDRKINEQTERVTKIRDIISNTKNISFEGITALSEYIAKEFLTEHDEIISPTTLRRNGNYRRILNRFMKKDKVETNELSELNEDLIIAHSENFQLNKDLSTAKDTISKLLSQRSKEKVESLEDRTHGQLADFDEAPCIALMKFIDHIGGFEIRRAGVFDTGQLNDVLIISPEDYPEFFTWYFKDGK